MLQPFLGPSSLQSVPLTPIATPLEVAGSQQLSTALRLRTRRAPITLGFTDACGQAAVAKIPRALWFTFRDARRRHSRIPWSPSSTAKSFDGFTCLEAFLPT